MPLVSLLKLMLPGLLPILVYVGASEFWGDLVGLGVGIGLGLAEFLFLLVVQKKVDGFVLGDTALLVVLGGISLGLDDAVFFRLKPVLVEGLIVGLLAASAWGPKNLVMGMVFKGEAGERLRQAWVKNPQAALSMNRNLSLITVVFAAHTFLSLASALWMPKEAWAFITGVLPFLLVIVIMVGQLALRWWVARR